MERNAPKSVHKRAKPFHTVLRPTFQRPPFFGTEQNASRRSRLNPANFFCLWTVSTFPRSVLFYSRANRAQARTVDGLNASMAKLFKPLHYYLFMSSKI